MVSIVQVTRTCSAHLDITHPKLLSQIQHKEQGKAEIIEGLAQHEHVCQPQVPAANAGMSYIDERAACLLQHSRGDRCKVANQGGTPFSRCNLLASLACYYFCSMTGAGAPTAWLGRTLTPRQHHELSPAAVSTTICWAETYLGESFRLLNPSRHCRRRLLTDPQRPNMLMKYLPPDLTL